MKLFKHIIYFSVINFLLCSNVFAMQINKALLFVNLDKKKHGAYIEEIFSNPDDYKILEDDYKNVPYESGVGMKMFELCSSLGEQELGGGGKILEINDNGVNKFVGFITYFIVKKLHNEKMQIGDGCIPIMAIHKDFRNKKFASDAMLYTLDFFKQNQCQTVWLTVHDDNDNGQKLYKKYKFKKTDVPTGYDGSAWWKLDLEQKDQS